MEDNIDKDLYCKDVIREIQRQLKLLHINIQYDSIPVIRRSLETRGHIVYLSAIDDLSEREKYERKTDLSKEKYKTKSSRIHFPDIKVGELVETFQCGIEDEYKNTVDFFRSRGTVECSDEIGFVCFLFLHEAGHWEQISKFDRLVKKYMEMDIDAERNNHLAHNEIIQKAMTRSGVDKLGGSLKLLEKEKEKLKELQGEYRNIPKEAEADKYALAKMNQLDFDMMNKNLMEIS